jgi:hypothetical protein
LPNPPAGIVSWLGKSGSYESIEIGRWRIACVRSQVPTARAVPAGMRDRFREIAPISDDVCAACLDEEYAHPCRQLAAQLGAAKAMMATQAALINRTLNLGVFEPDLTRTAMLEQQSRCPSSTR